MVYRELTVQFRTEQNKGLGSRRDLLALAAWNSPPKLHTNASWVYMQFPSVRPRYVDSDCTVCLCSGLVDCTLTVIVELTQASPYPP